MFSEKENVKHFMSNFGIRYLFSQNSRYYNNDSKTRFETLVKKSVIENERLLAGLLSDAINDDDSGFLSNLLTFADSNDIEIERNSFWKKSLRDIANRMFSDDENSRLNQRDLMQGRANHLLMAASRVDDFEWNNTFHTLYESQKGYGYIREAFSISLDMFSKKNKEEFDSFVKEEVFFTNKGKPSYAVRGALYKRYVERGLLDSKTARKIRSDASSEASIRGVKALLDNLDVYDDSDNLLLQFTDSKHDDVIVCLAKGLPAYLLSSLMGTSSYGGKRALERRFEDLEREKQFQKVGQ